MFRSLLVALLVVATAPALAGAPFTSTYAGAWLGVGVQSDGSSWDMVVTIEDKHSTVAYPRLHCGGQWGYVQIEPDFLQARETIDYGLENCITSGTILLSPFENDQLIYVWCGDDNTVSAIALLERSNASDRRYEAMLAATQAMKEQVGNELQNSTCQGKIWLGV